jgi:hypothetical protein
MSGRLLTACLLALVLLVRFAYASDHGGRDSGANVIVRQIMAADLARCSSSVNGVRLFSYAPSSGTEVAQIQSLGKDAIPPLAAYIRRKHKDGFTQLLAVAFLADIGGPATFVPLKQAFAPDQWEVTRLAALYGMFAASPAKAKPYVRRALIDRSGLVRERASELWNWYEQQGPPQTTRRCAK